MPLQPGLLLSPAALPLHHFLISPSPEALALPTSQDSFPKSLILLASSRPAPASGAGDPHSAVSAGSPVRALSRQPGRIYSRHPKGIQAQSGQSQTFCTDCSGRLNSRVALHNLGVLEARQRFKELLRRAHEGEETVIHRHGQPLAALVPLHQHLRPLRQSLTALRGTGRDCWPERQRVESGTPSLPDDNDARGLLLSQLPHGSLLGLDDSVLIPYLRSEPRLAEAYTPLLECIAMGHWRGVLSMPTIASVIGGALAAGRDDLAERWDQVFTDASGWVLVPTTAAVSLAAIRLQHLCGLGASPALELASALQGGATLMISRRPADLICGDPPMLPVLTAG